MADRPINDLPEARLLIDEKDFRVVEVRIGDVTEYVLETRDGRDAMGAERWIKFNHDSAKLRAIFGYLVRIAVKQENTSA
jgi:hypothetical protein